MAIATEYSRLVWKRSTETGVEPTIPTATTIDNTWTSTDLLIGEGFLNTADDRFWFRTDNGIVEVSLSGIASNNYYTELAYLSGNTIVFDRNDTSEAYAVDLDPILSGVTGEYIPLNITGDTTVTFSANTVTLSGDASSSGWVYGGDYSANFTDRSLVDKAYVDASSGSFTGGTITGDVTIQGDTDVGELSATSVSVLNSGATSREYFDYSSNSVESGVTNSAIVAGSGNTIQSGLNNVFVSGVDITATADDTAYFSNINLGGQALKVLSGGTYIQVQTDASRIALTSSPMDISFAISDETTAITSGTSKITLYAPYDFEITKVKASLTTSGSSTSTFDVNVGGSSVLTSALDLTSGTFVNSTTGITSSSVTEDDKITVDIDAAGTDAAGAKIYIIGTRTL